MSAARRLFGSLRVGDTRTRDVPGPRNAHRTLSGLSMARYATVFAGRQRRREHHGRTPAEMLANAASAERAPASELDLAGVSVLIVEDHADSRELLREIIASFGANVVVAEDGREALRTVGWVKPDLILCDLRMPGLDGFGFLDTLRHHPALSRTPVIAVTALGSDVDVRRTFDAGFNGHITKPIDVQTIALVLERVFWAHRRKPTR